MTMLNAFTSPYRILADPKNLKIPKGAWLLIADVKLRTKLASVQKNCKASLFVKSGENLKELSSYSKLLKQVAELEEKTGPIDGIIAAGGGSVGDAVAFLASTYRRGIRLIHIPTTYLAAIDSAFGGKTALNFGGAKNQLGTFYPAEMVYLIRSVFPQDKKYLDQGFAEIFKMALLDKTLWKKLQRSKADIRSFWKLAPLAISLKLKIVARDPYEKTGERKLLNLGHTFGHAIEKISNISHGSAVALGIILELEFLEFAGELSQSEFERVFGEWKKFFDLSSLLKQSKFPWSWVHFESLLKKDKKNINQKIQIICYTSPGKATSKSFEANTIKEFFYKHD